MRLSGLVKSEAIGHLSLTENLMRLYFIQGPRKLLDMDSVNKLVRLVGTFPSPW